jgi:molybdopterin converting factor small subunit
VWTRLAGEFPALGDLSDSTRLVRNGAFVERGTALRDGDELGLLPPYGGG